MKQLKKVSGFTLVELMVVIGVLAILVTLATVSYTGVQNRSRAADAKTNAASVKKVAESYYSQYNMYPTSVGHFSMATAELPSGITILTSGSLNATNGEHAVLYKYVGGSDATGACVLYWNFAPESGRALPSEPEYIGTATSANCGATLGAYPAP